MMRRAPARTHKRTATWGAFFLLRACGEFSLKQSDYRIKLVAVGGGAIKAKDGLRFSFDLVARKQE